jgi:hypothetical protein
MIDQLAWHGRVTPEDNPFLRGQQRAFTITFHQSSFHNLSVEDATALDLLYELSSLPDIEAIGTQPGRLPHIEIVPRGQFPGEAVAKVIAKNEWIRSSLMHNANPAPSLVCSVAGRSSPDHPDVAVAREALLAQAAHDGLDQDLLITNSPYLFDRDGRPVDRRANPRRIVDALKVVGLLLRSRGKYVISVSNTGHSQSLDPWMFYWVRAPGHSDH